jgi:phage gp29-like protein
MDIKIGRYRLTNKKAEKGDIIKTTKPETFYRTKAEIDNWREAVDIAEDVTQPDRTELMRIYQEIVIDDQIQAAFEQRKLMVLESPYTINRGETIDEEQTERFKSSWFERFVRHVLDARMYGYTIIQMTGVQNGEIAGFESVPRQYVDLDNQLVKKYVDQWNVGQSYMEPPYLYSVIEVKVEGLGLLNNCAPLAIWKKNAMALWSQYGELFGIPFRIGKTNMRDVKQKENMEEMLKNMGAAAWAVLDERDEVDLVETGHTDAYQVWDKMVERVNNSLSKLIIGQTMTMDDGSSRSQAEVHERTLSSYTVADKKLVAHYVNHELFPRMERFGLLPTGLSFEWHQDEKLSHDEKLQTITQLAPHFNISAETVEEMLGVPVEEKENQQEKLQKSIEEVNDLYRGFTEHGHEH